MTTALDRSKQQRIRTTINERIQVAVDVSADVRGQHDNARLSAFSECRSCSRCDEPPRGPTKSLPAFADVLRRAHTSTLVSARTRSAPGAKAVRATFSGPWRCARRTRTARFAAPASTPTAPGALVHGLRHTFATEFANAEVS